MYIFLFTVIPLYYFLFHELEKKRYAVRGAGFNFFCGSVTAVLYCFVGFLFFTAYRLPEFTFKNNFVYFFLTGTIYPVLCCVLIYLLFGKNDWKFKLIMFSDVVTAFYAVFLPYRIISVYDIADAFCIFVLPVVVISCLYILRRAAVFVAVINAVLWKKIVFGILALGLFLVMPAITEAAYYIGAPLWVRCVAEIGTFLLGVGSFFLFRGEVSFDGEFPPEWKKPAVENVASGAEPKAAATKKGKLKKQPKEKKPEADELKAEEPKENESEKSAPAEDTATVEKPAESVPEADKLEPVVTEEPAQNASEKADSVAKPELEKKNAPAKTTAKKGKKSSGSKKKK